MKQLTDDSLMGRALAWLARAVYHHRRLFLYPQLALFVVSILVTVKYLQFDPSRDNLVGANKKYHQNFIRFKNEFPNQDDLVVVVESEDPEKNRQFVERLGARVAVETNLFTDVIYKKDLKMFGPKALLFAPDKSPLTFSTNDIIDLPSFAAKLKQPSDTVSADLRERLADATRQALTNYRGSGADPVPLLAALTNDLNRIVRGQTIFDTQRFSGVNLRPETRQLLARNPDGEDRVRLNRLLIEDAYPLEIARSAMEDLLRTLLTFRPFIEQFTKATNLTLLFDMINEQFRTAERKDNPRNRALMGALPWLEHTVRDAAASLELPGKPPSPGFATLMNAGPEDTYITFDNLRIYLVTAQPRIVPPEATAIETETKQGEMNENCVRRLRALVAETQLEVPGLNVGLTGESVLDYDEMAQSQKDITLASIVSLILCALIFIYGYNETGRPIKATVCLVVGLAYTMAFATLTVGHLNILTITFVPMLIGLAIDFGVHLITRYEEELRRGRSEEAALTKAMVFTGQGIFTGAFTTAGAFLAMWFTNFRGIQEMGIICGGGLLICFVPMMTLLPVLLLRGHQNVVDHTQGDLSGTRARIENLWLKRPVLVAGLTAVLCGVAVSQFHKVDFDYDLRNMQTAGLPAVEFEKKLIGSENDSNSTNPPGKSVLFAAVIADSASQAVKLEQQITNLPAVAGVDTVADQLTEDQTGKLRLVGEIKQALSSIHFDPPDPRPVNIHELSRTLYSTYGYLGAALDDVGTNEPPLSRQLISLRGAIEQLRKEMNQGGDAEMAAHARQLAAFQQALFNDVCETFQALKNQDNRAAMRIEDLPEAMRNRFVGVTGKILLQVNPKKDVWQRKNQEEFIDQLRPVAPNVTGTPVQLLEYTKLLKDSYIQAAWYSLVAIAFLVLLHFRTLSSVVLALLPVAVGSIWLGGLMGLFHLQFNPANIMTLPLVIGIGVTNGVHILNRFAEEQTPAILARSTGKAVFVSALTAIAGFGSLILAKGQGIRSLGCVMSIGMATCMIAALTFLPALLNLIMRLRPPTKQPSVDNAPSTLGREEPR
jgi:hopanoid biosynthesis associated RND transporter like protein HpnN